MRNNIINWLSVAVNREFGYCLFCGADVCCVYSCQWQKDKWEKNRFLALKKDLPGKTVKESWIISKVKQIDSNDRICATFLSCKDYYLHRISIIELKCYSNSRKVEKTIYNQRPEERNLRFSSYQIYHLSSSHNTLTLYCVFSFRK